MRFPSGDAYSAALQHPEDAFKDKDLQHGIVEENALGLPRPYSGGLTITYHIRGKSKEWAVRCFKNELPDAEKRYEIASLLVRRASDIFVDATYSRQGIRVDNSWFPIVKMPWVSGRPLNSYVAEHLEDPHTLFSIASRFASLARRLRNLGIAHGDLQHGNIIASNSHLFLIDYDNIFAPEIKSLKIHQLGHSNYQHPNRDVAAS